MPEFEKIGKEKALKLYIFLLPSFLLTEIKAKSSSQIIPKRALSTVCSANQIEKTVYPRLQAELDKQHLTRSAFARKLGFDATRISFWMNGRAEPRLSSAIKVKEVLGVDMPLEELFAKSPVQQNE